MAETKDNAGTVVRPPIALLLAAITGVVADRLHPLPMLSMSLLTIMAGAGIVLLGLAFATWAIATFRAAGTPVEGYKPSTEIVERGPYRFSRNPIYVGMFIVLAGLGVAFNSFWLLVALLAFFATVRFGVVAREEIYLERKFGDTYRAYKSRVRRWL
jgi:protein-S-isoprenylcysteine O-methyltransferase Ste14